MTEVLGVSVGSSAVRMARPDSRLHTSGHHELDFHSDTVDAHWDRAEELAAESIGVVLAQSNGGQVEATGVAYRDQQQFGDIQQAMARQRLYNYRLVPEARAALAYLDASGEIGDYSTIGLYDLGSSGLTVSVIDRASGNVLLAERTTDISGDDFDRLICDNQLAKQGMDLQNTLGVQEFTSRCRIAKEQLSTSGAVCLPGDSGVILISRESFEALVTVPIEYSARLVRDVISRSPHHVDAIFLIGGGARIPLVEAILRSWTGLPVVTPRDPEAVAAKGAALLATPVENPERTVAPPAQSLSGAPDWLSPEPTDRAATSKRKIRGAALVAGGLAAVAALGLALGYGGSEEPASAPTETADTVTGVPSTSSSPATTTTTTLPPPPPATTEAAPAPAAPVETYEAPQYEEPAPAPAPAPAPPPLIPGLPQIELPQIQLPPPPVFELPRF
jgi:molecular chaperone HscA